MHGECVFDHMSSDVFSRYINIDDDCLLRPPFIHCQRFSSVLLAMCIKRIAAEIRVEKKKKKKKIERRKTVDGEEELCSQRDQFDGRVACAHLIHFSIFFFFLILFSVFISRPHRIIYCFEVIGERDV